jgi:hypothetical protein
VIDPANVTPKAWKGPPTMHPRLRATIDLFTAHFAAAPGASGCT